MTLLRVLGLVHLLAGIIAGIYFLVSAEGDIVSPGRGGILGDHDACMSVRESGYLDCLSNAREAREAAKPLMWLAAAGSLLGGVAMAAILFSLASIMSGLSASRRFMSS